MDAVHEAVRLHSWIYSLANKYCHGEDAEDLAQETIYKILSNSGRFDGERPFKPWCEVIMRNTYITQFYNNRQVGYEEYIPELDSISPERASDTAEIRNIISIIRKCARRSVNIECVIYFAKGYSHEEISSHFHIPVGTVKSRISNGRELIRKELEI